jgi:hypothetical protein
VIVVFYDSRDAAKVYCALHDNSVSFSDGGSLVELHCESIGKGVVDRVTSRLCSLR